MAGALCAWYGNCDRDHKAAQLNEMMAATFTWDLLALASEMVWWLSVISFRI